MIMLIMGTIFYSKEIEFVLPLKLRNAEEDAYVYKCL